MSNPDRGGGAGSADAGNADDSGEWKHEVPPKRVVIVGAGVAGLTAAMELVERGFEVEVVEKQARTERRRTPDDRYGEPEVDVGGMARTQWSIAPKLQPTRRTPDTGSSPVWPGRVGEWAGRQSRGDLPQRRVGEFSCQFEGKWEEQVQLRVAGLVAGVPAIQLGVAVQVVAMVIAPECDQSSLVMAVEGALIEWTPSVHQRKPTSEEEAPQLQVHVSLRGPWLPAVTQFPVTVGSDVDSTVSRNTEGWPLAIRAHGARVTVIVAADSKDDFEEIKKELDEPLGDFKGHTDFVWHKESPGLDKPIAHISLTVDWLAGEHGFRFFPSFYRHMFDTMKRIPLREDVSHRVHGGRPYREDGPDTVFDNLVTADELRFGLQRGRSFNLRRAPLRSVHDARAQIGNVLRDFGYAEQDVARLAARFTEYLTSGPERRKGYEAMTWSDFLEVDKLSDQGNLRQHVASAPQVLAAMTADDADARTIGSVGMQLVLDQILPRAPVDATLNGPTSTALFDPWQEYLESHGVRFTVAEFSGFEDTDSKQAPKYMLRPEFKRDGKPRTVAPADYYVFTLPPNEFGRAIESKGGGASACSDQRGKPDRFENVQKVIKVIKSWHLSDCSERDFSKLLNAYKEFKCPDKDTLYRHMVGIQFYFDTDISLVEGHTMYSDSAWGISTISQAQYWKRPRREYDGYRGVVSAIVTRWHEKDDPSQWHPNVPRRDGDGPKKAIDCGPDELARRVWMQIVATFDRGEDAPPLPQPIFFHIDDGMVWQEGEWTNHTPYLINKVGTWDERPGHKSGARFKYQVDMGKFVFAGVFSRTHTRVTSMESANESARHAVNAILREEERGTQPVEVWDMEEYEIDDLRPAKKLDDALSARGAAHTLRSPWTEAVLNVTPWSLVRWGLPDQQGRS